MNSESNPFGDLPGFKETIARIARVPPFKDDPSDNPRFEYPIRDEANEIVYKVVSSRELTPNDIRRALARAFSRTDAWPDAAGEAEIIA